MNVDQLIAALLDLPFNAEVKIEVEGKLEVITHYEQDDPEKPEVIILRTGEGE